jgi:hypothetical protein
MDQGGFFNRMRSIVNIDRDELEAAGVIATGEAGRDAWVRLNENPLDWAIRLGDERADKFWLLIEARQRPGSGNMTVAPVATVATPPSSTFRAIPLSDLGTEPAMSVMVQEIFLAETAPQDGTIILMWWPLVQLDEYGDLTDKPVDGEHTGAWVPTSWSGGGWDEPDWFDAVGQYFGDNYCYASKPTHWAHLPPNPPAKAGAL